MTCKCRVCGCDYTYDDSVGYSREICSPLCDGVEAGKQSSMARIEELERQRDGLLKALTEIRDKPWSDRWMFETQDMARAAIESAKEPLPTSQPGERKDGEV